MMTNHIITVCIYDYILLSVFNRYYVRNKNKLHPLYYSKINSCSQIFPNIPKYFFNFSLKYSGKKEKLRSMKNYYIYISLSYILTECVLNFNIIYNVGKKIRSTQ